LPPNIKSSRYHPNAHPPFSKESPTAPPLLVGTATNNENGSEADGNLTVQTRQIDV